jgi:hypothetical protein
VCNLLNHHTTTPATRRPPNSYTPPPPTHFPNREALNRSPTGILLLNSEQPQWQQQRRKSPQQQQQRLLPHCAKSGFPGVIPAPSAFWGPFLATQNANSISTGTISRIRHTFAAKSKSCGELVTACIRSIKKKTPPPELSAHPGKVEPGV